MKLLVIVLLSVSAINIACSNDKNKIPQPANTHQLIPSIPVVISRPLPVVQSPVINKNIKVSKKPIKRKHKKYTATKIPGK